MNWKAIMLTAGGVLLLRSIAYGGSLKRAEKTIATDVRFEYDTASLIALNIKILFNIKNPTKARMKMAPPLIRIYMEGKELASSSIANMEIPSNVKDSTGNIIINPFSETGFVKVSIPVPWLKIGLMIPDAVERIRSKESKDKFDIQVDLFSQIFMPVGSFPYVQSNKFQL